MEGLASDRLLVTKLITEGSSATIWTNLQPGSYWLPDAEGIFCEDALVLNVVP